VEVAAEAQMEVAVRNDVVSALVVEAAAHGAAGASLVQPERLGLVPRAEGGVERGGRAALEHRALRRAHRRQARDERCRLARQVLHACSRLGAAAALHHSTERRGGSRLAPACACRL
jgi:hypothetical protein